MPAFKSAIEIVNLLDKDGKVVGYATGTPEEAAAMSQAVWTSAQGAGAASLLGALKCALTARIQDSRRGAEAKGVLVDGNVFSTDIASQVKYAAALIHCMRNPGFTTSWKTANNGYVTLSAADIEATCSSVLEYIQLCYAWDQSMLAKIDAATTVDELRAMDLDEGRPTGCLPKGTVASPKRPEVVKGECVGSKGRAAVSETSTDTAGQVTATPAGLLSALAPGEIVTVKFSKPFAAAPHVVLWPASSHASTIKFQPYVTATTTDFTLNGTVALNANKEYAWNYIATP